MGEKQRGRPVPRDMQDQQAGVGEDPWDAAEGRRTDQRSEDTAVPETDEAGSGPQGAPRAGTVNPQAPVPDEPSA
ncbi:hypothetical protein ABZ646_21440 [Streptomyces sp. NPDC007162]|uniref:hypothetical protein n=1 Tax=Streptomyces sp. NPDC007162 TaxID=3156917 RepID=UPI0033F37976